MVCEIFEQAKFAHGGKHIAPVDLHRHGEDIDLKTAKAKDFALRCEIAGTAQYGADSRHEFPRTEWLCDVVVSPEFQAFDPVGFSCLCRQENDRRRENGRGLPYLPAEFESVHARQHDVQEKQRRIFPEGFGEDRYAAREHLNIEADRAQIVRNQAGDISVIFNDENQGTRRAREIALHRLVVGIRWQVHALRQATHEVNRASWLEEFISETLWTECCGSVSPRLRNREFMRAVSGRALWIALQFQPNLPLSSWGHGVGCGLRSGCRGPRQGLSCGPRPAPAPVPSGESRNRKCLPGRLSRPDASGTTHGRYGRFPCPSEEPSGRTPSRAWRNPCESNRACRGAQSTFLRAAAHPRRESLPCGPGREAPRS